MIPLIAGLIAASIAFAILYPDEPTGRSQRIVRVLVAAAVYVAAQLAISFVWLLASAQPIGWSPTDLALEFGLVLLPFSIAERVAGLFRPARRPRWALAAVLFVSGFHALLWFGNGAMDYWVWWVLMLELVATALAVGLAWYFLLPYRPRDSTDVFV